MKLICPHCGERELNDIFSSRPHTDGTRRRQRTCDNCHRTAGTVERVSANQRQEAAATECPPAPRPKARSSAEPARTINPTQQAA